MRIVLLGPPGAGKGTQGQSLSKEWIVPHVATGDIIREHIAKKTNFGRRIEDAIAAGNFVPDADIVYLVNQRLSQPDTYKGFILDGFPRNLTQAHSFTLPLDHVLDLVIDKNLLIERLAGRLVCPICDEIYHSVYHKPLKDNYCDNDNALLTRRADDDPEAVAHRFALYEEVTSPLRLYYQSLGLLTWIDASHSPQSVTAQINKVLKSSHKISACEV